MYRKSHLMKSFLNFLSLQKIHLLYSICFVCSFSFYFRPCLMSTFSFLFASLFKILTFVIQFFLSWSNTMQQKFSFFVGSIWKSLYGCQPSPVPTPPAEHSYLDNPLMFFKQAPSKVCISIFFSVAFVFAPHLYFAEGNRKAYICVCVGTTGHWHSLSRQHSHSQRGTLLSQPTANLLTNKYKYRQV